MQQPQNMQNINPQMPMGVRMPPPPLPGQFPILTSIPVGIIG